MTGDIRGYEILDNVPDGCRLVMVDDNNNWPVLRVGEYAVIDENDTELVNGELFLIKMGMERIVEIIFQVYRRENGIWFCPLNRPRSSEQLDQWMREGRTLRTSDGPLREEYLPEKMLGRVIGIYQSSFDESRLVTINP